MEPMAADQSPYAPPKAMVAVAEVTPDAYFAVGAVKFSLMSLTTFGLYTVYWFYQNWMIIRDREHSDISPFWRAFFSPLWTFSMGTRLAEQAKAQNVPITLPVATLGILYLLFGAVARLPSPFWLLAFFAFIPILPFEFAVRRLDGNGSLAKPIYGHYSGWNIAWLVVGSLLLVLTVIGSFIPEGAA